MINGCKLCVSFISLDLCIQNVRKSCRFPDFFLFSPSSVKCSRQLQSRPLHITAGWFHLLTGLRRHVLQLVIIFAWSTPYFLTSALLVAGVCYMHSLNLISRATLSLSPSLSLSLAPLHSMSDILSLRAKPFNLDFNYHVSFVIRL